ncbi:MAG: preprotein translocase subunit SecE [Candidatus Nealsonbacteria bacterium]|nr:preprotein translocase subunit SecE [Candidatus Nealsonbacteria bacterium]
MNIVNFPQKIINFLKEVQLEVKKVNWPTREETLKYTFIVIIFSALVALFLGGLDVVFNNALKMYILH